MKITTLPVGQVNRIIEEIFNRRRKFDSRGLIYTKDVFKAVRATFYCEGKLDEKVIKDIINFLVKERYLRFNNNNGYLQFFVNFKDVIRDDDGIVIGVRW